MTQHRWGITLSPEEARRLSEWLHAYADWEDDAEAEDVGLSPLIEAVARALELGQRVEVED